MAKPQTTYHSVVRTTTGWFGRGDGADTISGNRAATAFGKSQSLEDGGESQSLDLEDRCVTDKEAVKARWIVAGTAALLTAYLVQALFSVGDQSPESRAFVTMGHLAMRKQYNGIPQMRVVRAFVGPTQCAFWNFEATWGRCVGIGLDVRDYKPEHQAVVDAQARLLGEQLRKPCELLPTLNLPDAHNISQALGCDAGRRTFKLKIHVTAVTVINEETNPSDPYMWRAMDHQNLYTYILRGEI
jgi:hypothetical protein